MGTDFPQQEAEMFLKQSFWPSAPEPGTVPADDPHLSLIAESA